MGDQFRFQREQISKGLWKGLDWLCNLIIIGAVVVGGYFLVRIFLVESYRVPSSSMEPTLLPGDQIWVFKPILGPRLFADWEVIRTGELRYRRLPGLRNAKRNDILVINRFSTHQTVSHSGIGVFYIKRCIGIPGDTLRIENGFYRVSGCKDTLGVASKQRELALASPERLEGFTCFNNGWTLHNYGPLYIPKKGDTVPLDTITAYHYREAIEAETKKRVEVRDGEVYLGETPCAEYTFTMGCYFFAGDNAVDSNDGRYWGVVSESEIVAKAVLIWDSVGPMTQKRRWERIFKPLW